MQVFPYRRLAAAFVLLVLTMPLGSTFAATYYSDPIKGEAENDGSHLTPWPSLQRVIEAGLLQQLQPGDTLLLRTGYHGLARFSGENVRVITIAAEQGQIPLLGRLEVRAGSKWTIRSLSISPEHGDISYAGPIVSLGEFGPSSDLLIEDCYVFGSSHPEKLAAAQWIALNNGIYLGRNGTRLVSRNNYLFNTRHAIQCAATESLIEGCIVENFSGDGLRLLRDRCVARWNVVRNSYCDEKHDGDRNHDDLLQCFLFGKGSGVIRNITITENLLISHSSPSQPFPGQAQGIGIFDGPVVNFTVTDNVISVDHWHGLTLTDAQNCTISKNVVWSPCLDSSEFRPWIMLGTKKHLAKGNNVSENYACQFRLEQPDTKEFLNRISTGEIFDRARQKLISKLGEKFGRIHQLAQKDRFTGQPVK